MLTRLRVSGFKNLLNIDVRFGPFTCIAGSNGVGKSNLFDAIQFLSLLADRSLVEAALSIRNEDSKTSDLRSLFYKYGEVHADEMSFKAEMIVPSLGIDDLGQPAKASITFLSYEIIIQYKPGGSTNALGQLELTGEALTHIKIGEARDHLKFKHSSKWRKSAVTGRRTSPLISTEIQLDSGNRLIKLHQEGTAGRTIRRLAANLPRTVLSASTAAESPTALLAKAEMRSWRMLQLEPSALRKPDEYTAPAKLGANGAHMPATLYHLAKAKTTGDGQAQDEQHLYGHVASRLAELIDDVQGLWVDNDPKRELLTLYVQSQDGTSYPARALSDGTLRFLALAVIDIDPNAQGVICLEEPENGIHPDRIPAMLRLLRDIATDTTESVDSENPLRQIIVNTHSPSVVAQIPDDSLLLAVQKNVLWKDRAGKEHQGRGLNFQYLADTWRSQGTEDSNNVSLGKLISYLQPISSIEQARLSALAQSSQKQPKRVVDRGLQILLPLEN